MKKTILWAITVLVFFATACSDIKTITSDDLKNEGKLKVYASFYPMLDFVKKIGGDKVDAVNLVPAGTEPHDYEPAVSDIVGLEKADVFVYNGAGMEHWVQKVLDSLHNKKLIVVEASKGVALLSGGAPDKEAGHDATDSHVWLNPQNAKTELKNIKDALSAADPKNAGFYEENYGGVALKLDALDDKMKQTLAACAKKEIVVSHQAYGYLCAAYGLTQLGITGLEADSEPDPARMAEIIDFVKQNNVRVIFSEELVSPKIAETIAKETGARTQILNPLEGLSEEAIAAGEDYFSVMQANLEKLKEALE